MKNIIWNVLKRIGNLNFSIFMLLSIACISILGTIIQQDQSINYYQLNYPILNNAIIYFNWKIIIICGLDHIYTTWWFIFLLIVFFLSLMICTFSRQLPGLKNARTWKFVHETQTMKKFKNYTTLENKLLSNIVYILNSQEYYVFHKRFSIYAYKGLFGRIAPIFVHISIIMTLTGSMMGLFGGFMVQEMIPNGEIFHLQNIVKSGFTSYLPNILGQINNFNIEYNQDNSIKQFFSSISLLDNQGNNLINKVISVNSPLIFKGVTFYQTDWKINSIRLQIGTNLSIQENLNKIKIGSTYLWVCNLPIDTVNSVFIVITGLKEKILIYNFNGLLIAALDLNESIKLNDNIFVIKEIMTSTGLQIKTDPGLVIVYFGFLMLMISVFISYLSYSQIWIISQFNIIELVGSTNRAALTFEEDFIIIQKEYLKSLNN